MPLDLKSNSIIFAHYAKVKQNENKKERIIAVLHAHQEKICFH